MSTFDPATATVTGSLTINAPTGDVIVHDPSSDPDSGGFFYKLAYAAIPFGNGPPSAPNYINDVWALGINTAGVGTRDDLSRPYCALHWSTKSYKNTGDTQPSSEFYLLSIDTNGVSRRPIAWSAKYDGSDSVVSVQTDLFVFYNAAAKPKISFGLTSGIININDGLAFYFAKNNVPIAYQVNAAGNANIPLPYINSNDHIVISRPITGSATGAPVNVINPVVGGTAVLNLTAPNAASAGLQLTAGTGVAAKTGQISVDNGGNLVVRQVTTGGALYFDFNDLAVWRDRNAGFAHRMVISSSSAQFNVPLKAPSYTVATLPNPSAAGAGALIYVTDAAGGPSFACSDGRAWRVVAPLGAAIS